MQRRKKNNKEQMWLGGALKTAAGGAASLIPGIGPAIGVPLMGAGMGEMGQHFMNKEQQVPQQSMWQPSVQPNYLPTFQGGGDLGMKNNIYADYDVGQDHSGPDEGIEVDAMGQPVAMSGGQGVALTEKGEVSFNGQVFSDKSKLPGHKDKTFANEAKRIVKKYKFYLGEKLDKVHPMSQKALERELSKLFEIQEAKKGNMMHKDDVEQMMQEQQMAIEQQMQQGMEQGMGQEEQMAQDPMMQQMAMEQQQGGGMPMEGGMPMMRRGGYLPKLSGGNKITNLNQWYQSQGQPFPSVADRGTNVWQGKMGQTTPYTGSAAQNNQMLQFLTTDRPKIDTTPLTPLPASVNTTSPNLDGLKSFGNSRGYPTPQNAGTEGAALNPGDRLAQADPNRALLQAGIGMVNPIIGMLTNTKQKNVRLPRATPQRLDLSGTRRAAEEIATTTGAGARRQIARTAPTRGMLQAGQMGTAADMSRARMEADIRTRQAEQEFNIGERARVDQFNAQARTGEIQDRAMLDRHQRQVNQALLASMGNIGQQAFSEHNRTNDLYNYLNMMSPDLSLVNQWDPTKKKYSKRLSVTGKKKQEG